MRRLILLLIAIAAVAAVAAPAAHAGPAMWSVMMDDDQLVYRGDAERDWALNRMKLMGVDYARVTVLWEVAAEHAKRTKKGKKRRKFRAEDPSTYPPGNWDRYDRLVRAAEKIGVGIYFNVTGPGPRWAHGKAPKSMRKYRRFWKPKPREFYKFVTAVGKRYDGTYHDENDNGAVLPRVHFWSIWNEPNQHGWLMPQWEKGQPASPRLYRELWHYGRTALAATGHDRDVILAGETAPLGSTQRNTQSPMYPKRFIRELFCISPSGSRYTGASAKRRGCDLLDTHGQWKYTAWAHHPYTKLLAPTKRDRNRDSITMANWGELSAMLDQIGARTGYVPKTNLVASTEFGYETKPPDPFVGIPLKRQAAYINEGEYLAWRDQRTIAQSQFLLKDVPGIKRFKKTDKRHWFTYQSGLVRSNGKPKPAAAAFTLPLHVVSSGGGQTQLWGRLRFLPRGTQTEVYLQFRPQGASQFTTVGEPVAVTDPWMFWTASAPIAAPGQWRAVWVNPVTGTPVISREADVQG
jgi:hypothetical protein